MLQSELIEAGLCFEPHAFPYNPHCTISASAMLTSTQEGQVLKEVFPTQEFVLSRLSLYQAVDGQVALLRAFRFEQ
jgi:hypothetical protein